MSDATPKAWLCKHCGERVDPTMAWCWNCSHDSEGKHVVFDAPAIGDGLLEHCPNCRYDLRGNSDATHCPECGQELPKTALQYALYGAPANRPRGWFASLSRRPLRMLVVGLVLWTAHLLLVFVTRSTEQNGNDALASILGVAADALGYLGSGAISLAIGIFIIFGFNVPEDDSAAASLPEHHRFSWSFFASAIGRFVFLAVAILLLIAFVTGQAAL